MEKHTLNENEAVIFVLNTGELSAAGFDGSFNDLASDLEDVGASISGEYDEDGTPIMSIYGIEAEDLEDILSDYGIEDPTQFTADVEDGETFDFDEDQDGDVPEDDDEEFEIVDDEDDEELEIVDDEPDMMEESRRFQRTTKPLGTQNLSEAVTIKILNQVKDLAIQKRIMDDVKKAINEQQELASYKVPLPFAGIKVNGKEIIYESENTLKNMLHEAKFNYKKYYKKYKSLNESEDQTAVKYGKVLRKQHKLINLLENVIAFKNGTLFEGLFDDSETGNIDNTDNTQEMSDQTATLTSIVFKVKNADDFIKTLVDNGIPEEALEKGGSSTDGSDENNQEQPQDQAPADGGMGADMGGGAPMGGQPAPAGGGNPFESLSVRLSNKLNEDDANPFADDGQDAAGNPFGDSDQPSEDSNVDPLQTESNDNAEEGEEVRLVDTSFAAKVQEILQNVYGYSKEDFENKIGGEIEDDGQDGSDGSVEENPSEESAAESGDDDGTEEEINPADIFQDI